MLMSITMSLVSQLGFFYSCIIGVTIMAILVFIMVKFFFVDVSFDEEGFEDK